MSPCIVVKSVIDWTFELGIREETMNTGQVEEFYNGIDYEFMELTRRIGHSLQALFMIQTERASFTENCAAGPTKMAPICRN